MKNKIYLIVCTVLFSINLNAQVDQIIHETLPDRIGYGSHAERIKSIERQADG